MILGNIKSLLNSLNHKYTHKQYASQVRQEEL